MKPEIILTQQYPSSVWIAGIRWIGLSRRNHLFPWPDLVALEGLSGWNVFQEYNKKRQYGHVETIEFSGHKVPHVYSIALALQGQLGNDWIGLFRASPKRIYLVAVKDHLVLHGTDKLFDNLAEGISAYVSLQSQFKWDNCYISEGIKVEGEVIDFNALLLKACQRTSAFELHESSNRLSQPISLYWKPALTALLALGLVGSVLSWGIQRGMLPRLSSLSRQSAESIELASRLDQQGTAGSENALLAFKSWIDEMMSLPTAQPEWVLTSATCDGETIEAIYQGKDNTATLGYLEYSLKRTSDLPVQIEQKHGYCVVKRMLKSTHSQSLAGASRSDQALLPTLSLHEATEHLLQLLRSANVTGTLGDSNQSPPATSFEIRTLETPYQLFPEQLKDSLRFQSISVKIQPNDQLVWTIKGTVYGRA